jgi:hypothetical protein
MIIGITGKKYHGKDYLADYICMLLNMNKYAFATKLKKACQVLFDFTDEQLNGNLKEVVDIRYNKSPRQIMQEFGTDFIRRNYGENFFCINIPDNSVVSDVRFENEAAAIRRQGGIIIKVFRDNIVDDDLHESENNNIKYDFYVKNDNEMFDRVKMYLTNMV